MPTTVDVKIDTAKTSVEESVSGGSYGGGAVGQTAANQDSNQFDGTFSWGHVREKHDLGGVGNSQEVDENVYIGRHQAEWGYDSTRYLQGAAVKQDTPYFDFTLNRDTGDATWSALRGASSPGHCTAY